MTCKFCDKPAALACQWPVEKFFLDHYESVVVGDRVKRATEVRGRPPATVEFVGPWFANMGDVMPSGLQITLRIGTRRKEIVVKTWSPVQLARMAPCMTPACDSHLREIDEDKAYCCDHWHSWESVA